MSDFLILTTLARGTSSHPRFMVADQFGRIWTAEAWSDNDENGLLFADLDELGRVCGEILVGQAAEKPVVRFLVSMEIEIRSEKKLAWIDVAVGGFEPFNCPWIITSTEAVLCRKEWPS